MKITAVEFFDEEIKFLNEGIIAIVLSDIEGCNRKKGTEFEFTKENYPFLEETLLVIKIELYDEYRVHKLPDPDELIARSVLNLKIILYNVYGEPLKTNLDAEFDQLIYDKLTI